MAGRDPSLKGYVRQEELENVLTKHFGQLTRTNLQTVCSVLDPNSRGELNYKQLFDLVMGADEAQKFFAGQAMQGTRFGGVA